MTTLFTRSLKNKLIQLLLLVSLPALSQAQTIIANYDFNAASNPNAPLTTAAGITSTASASKVSTPGGGTSTGPNAYVPATTAGNALTLTNLSAASTDYFQITLAGPALPKYSAFKLYFQSFRTITGPTTLTLQYSLNGVDYITPPTLTTASPTNPSFAEATFDLSAITTLNAPASLNFRLQVSGSSGGNARIDNFQVQATNTVDPLLNGISPGTIEAGSTDFALTVAGSNFKPGAVVSFNGQNLATTYNSSTSLGATVPAAAVAVVGNYPVAVTNPDGAVSPATTFTVTPALARWTGAAGTKSWFDAANWSTRNPPTPTDEVVLDHLYVAGSYTVSLDLNTAVSIKSLTVNPGAGDSIFVLVPASNTLSTALTLSNVGAGVVALAIYDKGVVTNASGAPIGSAGIDVANLTDSNPGASVFIYNGGSYRQASGISHRPVAENLSATSGTEQGIFDFRLPATASSSYTLSTSARAYGTLILRNRNGAANSGYLATASTLAIRGNLLIGASVTLTATINNDLQILGNIRSQGTLQLRNTTPASPTSQLVFVGARPQTVSGTFIFADGIGLAINNPAGVTLATPLSLSGPLTLTSGILTTTATNLLTLGQTASVGGGSASFINGPLARKTAAGALTGLVFPVGSGTSYYPVTLNATAQDATTYLVTQKEGSAAGPTDFLAGTPALPTLTRVSRVRSVNITPIPAANNFSGTVTLSFGADDNVNQPSDASFTIGKNSNSAGWQNIGVSNGGVFVTTAATATIGASGTITSQTFTSFSDFALASTSPDAAVNPLPVTLISFTARRQAADVRLNWATASELRNARFEVQRSLDGQLFTTVATVAGHGTAVQAHQYTALDPAAPTAVLYYRLAQVDTDGRTTFSPVVVLAATSTAVLYPNPARDRLVVPAPAGTSVRVFDLLGRLVQTLALPPSGEVSVVALPAGNYVLQLGEGAQRLRFSKE